MFKLDGFPRERIWGSLAINLTNRCNISCRYCFQNSGPRESQMLHASDIRRILSFFQPKQSEEAERYLYLTGGEILLHPEIFEIIAIALEYGYILRLQTNGILLGKIPEKKFSVFSEERILIKVSLDGWNAEIHEAYRQKSTFDRVIAGIRRLREYSKNIGIKTVVHDLNFSNLPLILDTCLDLKVRSFSHNMICQDGRGKFMDFRISESDVIRKLIPYFLQRNYAHLLNGNRILRYGQSLKEECSFLMEPAGFYVDFDGCIYPNESCLESQRIGSVFGVSLEKEFDENKVFGRKTNIPPEIVGAVTGLFSRIKISE